MKHQKDNLRLKILLHLLLNRTLKGRHRLTVALQFHLHKWNEVRGGVAGVAANYLVSFSLCSTAPHLCFKFRPWALKNSNLLFIGLIVKDVGGFKCLRSLPKANSVITELPDGVAAFSQVVCLFDKSFPNFLPLSSL